MSVYEIFNAYRMRYATGSENCECSPDEVSEEVLLQPWRKAKGEYLMQLFGDQLILERPFTYRRGEDELRNDMSNFLDRNIAMSFRKMMWSKVCDLLGIESRQWYWNDGVLFGDVEDLPKESQERAKRYKVALALENAFSFDSLMENHIGVDKAVSCKLDDGRRISIGLNEKPMRVIGKFVKLFPDDTDMKEQFDKYCVMHSQVLNQKTLKGTICLSIHPLDYATASDNANGWSSCMSWQEQGCYRIGTVEMMNSPMVICCYVKSDNNMLDWNYANKHYVWNSKKWRAWAILDIHQCLINKQYPYDNDDLATFCLNWIRELAAEKLGWTFDAPKLIYGENPSHHGGREIDGGYTLVYDMNKMYNDININGEGNLCCLRHNYAKLWKMPQRVHINVSGVDQCMCCGKVSNWDDQTEGSLFGTCCDAENGCHCARCGDYVNEDDIYYGPDDVAYCQDCYNDIFGHCEICDSDVEREYMNDVTVHIPEDMIKEGLEKINAMPEVDGYFDLSDWQITDYSLRSFSVCDQCCKDYHWRIVHDPRLNGHQFFGDFIDTTNKQMDEIDISMLLRHCDLPGTHYNFRFNHSTREKMQAVWMDLWDKYMK